ncbi:MBOAT family O-acyltransferase [Erysipelotrichaceae bacterium 51-3]
MQFTDFSFLFVFLPLSYLIYLLLNRMRLKTSALNFYLLLISLLFYSAGGWTSLFILGFVLLWNWICAGAIQYDYDHPENESTASQTAPDKTGAKQPLRPFLAMPNAKKTLWICIAVNILLLLVYKYIGVWIEELTGSTTFLSTFVMPIGLSFYIFSSISYVADVYMKKAAACSLVDFGLFAAFFSRVNMGPIGHYAKFKDQLAYHPQTRRGKRYGAALFLQGLFFKVFLADNLALVFSGLENNSTWLGTWLLAISYMLELYFDFAGYSRMARGLASLFGFDIPANFDKPYMATSIQDFWRRWHISLTDWFREYIYIPLGGNRVSDRRWILNLFVVWFLTGLWHGPTLSFMVWGLLQGALILLEHQKLNALLEKLPSFGRHVYVLLMAMISWILFFSPSLLDGLQRIGRLFFIGIAGLANTQALFYLFHAPVLFAAAIFCAGSLPKKAANWISRHIPLNKGLLGAFGYGLGFLLCLAMLISQTSQAFLYTAF